ncbi:MAG: membrane integrity-associated transporter subunit PqiC [Hyphomonadaceae bacterium]|nr:membrane integrity-associated transporter subunit PqiC [Hyphomonadaceae bacterium]
MIRAASLLASLTLLGGCISLLPEPPPAPRTFALQAGDVAALQGQRIDAVIGVTAPGGSRAVLAADVIWRTGDELAYVAQTQWADHAADALQSMLVETLARQGRFAGATVAGEARAGYEIRWEVTNFEIDGDAMQARFRADVRVLASPGRRLIAQEVITAEAPVASRSATEASQALTRAAREGSARIGVFAADAAAQAEAQAAAEEDHARAASIRR